jgi:hypothetical protein
MTRLQSAELVTGVVVVGVAVAIVQPLLVPAQPFEIPSLVEGLGLAGGIAAGLGLAWRFGGTRPE